MFKPNTFSDAEIAAEYEASKAALLDLGNKKREGNKSANALCVAIKGKTNKYDRGPCHGFMGRDQFSGCRVILSMTQHNQTYSKSQPDRKHAVPFFDYLANRSPYRSFILNKDANEIYDYGIIFRTDVPSNLLLQMLITSRIPTEFNTRAESYYNLTAAGCQEDAALLLSYCFKVKQNADSLELVSDIFYSGHSPMDSDFSVKAARNFARGNVVRANEVYHTNQSYSYPNSVYSVFAENGDAFSRISSSLAEKNQKGHVKLEGLNPWQPIQDKIDLLNKKAIGNRYKIPLVNCPNFFSDVHNLLIAE